jgi:hypothetical protein
MKTTNQPIELQPEVGKYYRPSRGNCDWVLRVVKVNKVNVKCRMVATNRAMTGPLDVATSLPLRSWQSFMTELSYHELVRLTEAGVI